MRKTIIVTGATLGLLAVIAGAFGAHALKGVLTPAQLETWHTAVEYQFYHVFALLFLSTLRSGQGKLIYAAYWLFTLGIALFCGSVYLLSSREVLTIENVKFLGPVTPVGGLLFISGWIITAIAALKERQN